MTAKHSCILLSTFQHTKVRKNNIKTNIKTNKKTYRSSFHCSDPNMAARSTPHMARKRAGCKRAHKHHDVLRHKQRHADWPDRHVNTKYAKKTEFKGK